MDNLTHSLVGLALAESGLKRRSGLGTATLLIGANLPDIDGLAYVVGTGTDALAFRRGWTHGVLAVIALPLLLTAAVVSWDRLVRRRWGRGVPEVRVGWVLGLATIGVASHPLLDLLNTYGVRLLMPFSPRWFYGDALFIIDPWLWLALGVGVILSRRRARLAATSAPAESPPSLEWAGRPAHVALVVSLVYMGLMASSSRLGVRVVEQQAEPPAARRTLVSPVFLNPFRRTVIRDLGTQYEEGELTWGWQTKYAAGPRVSVGWSEPGVPAASATRAGVEFLQWARFPQFRSEQRGDSLSVLMSDLRYATGRTGGRAGSWASVSIRVPAKVP